MTEVDSLLYQAITLHQAGQLGEAEKCYRQILTFDARNVRALAMLGLARLQQENGEEGIRLLSASLEVSPNQPDVLNNLGYALQLFNRLDEALACYDKALVYNPGYVSAYFNRGNVLHDLERYAEAVASYAKAISLRPDYADAYINMGNTLQELKRHEEALANYEKALALTPHRADVHYNLGAALLGLKRHQEAAACYDKAISLNPDQVDAYSHRASIFMDQGMMEMAEKSLDDALRRDPEHIPSLFMLSTLGKYTEQDERFQKLQSLYQRRNKLPVDERISLDFAMGRTLEKLKRFDEAFHAYEEANRLYHSEHAYDDSADEEVVEWITSFFSAGLFEECAKAAASLPAPPDDRIPVFILGMPRSGTTLVEQILATHPSVFGAEELTTIHEIVQKIKLIPHDSTNWATFLSQLRRMGREYLDTVWELAPDACFISDKMPANYRYLGLIHLMLPNAKIIHTMRDPLDSCFSCYATRFDALNDYSYDLHALGRHYLRYKKLMKHWHRVLPPGQILDVRYEDTVADLEGQARRLLDYLGLPWDPSCLKFYETRRVVQTASVAQVRKPIYSSSVARWKRFEKHLGPLIEVIRTST